MSLQCKRPDRHRYCGLMICKGDIMTDAQKRVKRLLAERAPNDWLTDWAKGRIPNHYKRISINYNEQLRLAKIGFIETASHFKDIELYFTQSIFVGAALSGDYDKIHIVTSSQYGKSFTMGFIAILLAIQKNEPVYIVAANKSLTEIIMGQIIKHLQYADESIKEKLLESTDKIEKMQTALSQRRIALKGGGSIEAITLGEVYADKKKGNNMIGRAGHIIMDEAALVSDETAAELGRAQFARDDDKQYMTIKISNPHNPGSFYNAITADNIGKRELVVWMDILTALEEGRVKSEEQIENSEFYADKSTCIRYLLCELEDFSERTMFEEPTVVENEIASDSMIFIGIDSAGRGKDKIKATCVEYKNSTGKLIVHKTHTIKKDETWEEGKTSKRIINRADSLLKVYQSSYTCVDIGHGIYLVEGLVNAGNRGLVKSVDFGERPTPIRKKIGQFAAVKASNKRAEMYLDLMDLIENDMIQFTEDVYKEAKEEMMATQYMKKPNGTYQIMEKKKIKRILGRSPDTLDSIVLAVHAAVLFLLTDDVLMYQK